MQKTRLQTSKASLIPKHSSTRLQRLKRDIYAYRYIYLLMLPALVYVSIFQYGPMYGAQIAFRDFRARLGIWGSEWVGLENIIRFFIYPSFWKILRNTAGLSAYGIIAGFPMPVLLALFLNEARSRRLKKTVQMVTYAPYFLSSVVECGLILIFFHQTTGIVNNVIELLGGTRTAFLTDPKWFKTLYVFTGVWKNTGWNAIIYLAALSSVDQECIEAARVDGASRFKIMLHIHIPHIIPTMIILLILSTGNILSVGFEKVFLLQNDLNFDTSTIISTYTYRVGMEGGELSYSTAIGLFNSAVNVVVLLIVNAIADRMTKTSLL